jgi:hypothetical protein
MVKYIGSKFSIWNDIQINESCLIDKTPIDRKIHPALLTGREEETAVLYIEPPELSTPSQPINQSNQEQEKMPHPTTSIRRIANPCHPYAASRRRKGRGDMMTYRYRSS